MRKPNARRCTLLLCSVLAALCGCRAPSFQDRMDDGAELLRLNLGGGPGFLVNVHATRCLALGVGVYEARRYGFRNGRGWVWDERRYDTNLVAPIWGWEDVTAVVHGNMPVTPVRGDEQDPRRPGEEPGKLRWARMPLTLNDPNRGWFEVSASVHVIWVGVDVGFDVGELVDFLCGWAGLDPAGDDEHTGEPVERHEPGPSPPPTAPNTEIGK